MKKPKEKHRNLTLNEAAVLFHVSSITIFNWVKEGLLTMDEDRCITEESIRHFKAKYAGKVKLQSRANKLLKDEHDPDEVSRLIQTELAGDAFDETICQRYEFMLSESYRNKEGIFYTPMPIVEDMLQDVAVDANALFLDPCCGCGNFLVEAIKAGVAPWNVYGFDTDPNAVLIARRRIKALTGHDAPHVVCADFLQEASQLDQRFDLVFTNPPWGKKLSKTDRKKLAARYHAGGSTDTCSLFLFSILSVLKPEAVVGLLMPESFFKIAVYEDARRTLLKETLLQIKDYGKPFGNMYSAVSLVFRHTPSDESHEVACCDNHQQHFRLQKSFLMMPRQNLNYWTKAPEMRLVEELMAQPHLLLKGHATWGLGIVTGNNAKMCKRSRRPGLKPVYRGKDILPGGLKQAELFVNPQDFPRFQQISAMTMFQAPEKLIYRFISSDLVFYCDTKQRLILNSANMLVLDDDFPLTASQLAEVLNSPLTNWLYKQLFNTHKVLRGDLEMLPILTDSSLHGRFDLLNLDR